MRLSRLTNEGDERNKAVAVRCNTTGRDRRETDSDRNELRFLDPQPPISRLKPDRIPPQRSRSGSDQKRPSPTVRAQYGDMGFDCSRRPRQSLV
jgi:hypothetical protein